MQVFYYKVSYHLLGGSHVFVWKVFKGNTHMLTDFTAEV